MPIENDSFDEKRRISVRTINPGAAAYDMTLSIPPELEQHINSLVLRGESPNAEAVLVDAVKALLRNQERKRIESLLEATGIDERRLEQLLQEAEDSGDYTEMTAQDWEGGFGNLESPVARLAFDVHIVKRLAAKRDLTQHFVWFAEQAGIEVARRFQKSAEKTFHDLAAMPRMGPLQSARREVRRRAHVACGRLRQPFHFLPPTQRRGCNRASHSCDAGLPTRSSANVCAA